MLRVRTNCRTIAAGLFLKLFIYYGCRLVGKRAKVISVVCFTCWFARGLWRHSRARARRPRPSPARLYSRIGAIYR